MGIKAAFKALVQGNQTVEGGRDVTNTHTTEAQSTQAVVDKNNYKTYSGQVKFSHDAYNGRLDYGCEMYGSIVETRQVFIGGEGLSVIAKKKSTQDYIDKFLTLNKFHGSMLMDTIRTGEIEGKDLMVMKPKVKKIQDQETKYIKVQNIQWWTNNYTIVTDPLDTSEITKVKFKPKSDESVEKTLPMNKSVFVKLGGTDEKINDTTNKLHRILTDIENFSRMKYDLRKNHHLFAKIMAYWKTLTQNEAKAINNDINSGKWEIGQSYAGPADFKLTDVPLGALEALTGEMLLAAKIISTNTGIPIHWLAWPELMSNRATAENLLEVVNAGTKRERLIWEEAYRELIDKSMVMAIDAGFEDSDIMGEYHLELSLVSMANLKAIQETWLPLQQMDVISMGTLRSKIPAINPTEEKKMVEKEKKENVDAFINDDLRGVETTNLQEDEDDEDTRETAT